MLRWTRFQWWDRSMPKHGRENVGGRELPYSLGTKPLIGHRHWRVTRQPSGELGLQSMHVNLVWSVRETAECRSEGYKGTHGGHAEPAPYVGCACGLYAELPDTPITEWSWAIAGRVSASGSVALSGRIIKCQRGYKAQYAEMLAPVVLDVSCSGDGSHCIREVSRIVLADDRVNAYYGTCADHEWSETHRNAVVVDADVWMPEAARTLTEKYDLEVLSYI